LQTSAGAGGFFEKWVEAALSGEQNRPILWPKLTRGSRRTVVAQAVHNLVTHLVRRSCEEGCCGFRRADWRQVMGALERRTRKLRQTARLR
jgi:hypothetical protein